MSDIFGDLEETLEAQRRANTSAYNAHNERIYKVFCTEAGQELLKTWTDATLMKPSVATNSTEFGAGLIEGEKNFVRGIIRAIKAVEEK